MAEASLSRRFLQFGGTGICVVRPQVILFSEHPARTGVWQGSEQCLATENWLTTM